MILSSGWRLIACGGAFSGEMGLGSGGKGGKMSALITRQRGRRVDNEKK